MELQVEAGQVPVTQELNDGLLGGRTAEREVADRSGPRPLRAGKCTLGPVDFCLSGAGPYFVGRNPGHAIQAPGHANQVSRTHASFLKREACGLFRMRHRRTGQ